MKPDKDGRGIFELDSQSRQLELSGRALVQVKAREVAATELNELNTIKAFSPHDLTDVELWYILNPLNIFRTLGPRF